MPRVVTLIKNCCYFSLIVALVSAVSSLFVWQAEVYQSTIDEQVRLMKLDISAMKKENHLMEIKLNEQYGKHDDLKEEFRYILKQAKWQIGDKKDEAVDVKKREVPHYELNIGNKPDTNDVEEAAIENEAKGKENEDDSLKNALENVNVGEDDGITDMSKRTHVLIISEKKGGSDVLGKLIAYDENIFFLPSVSSVIQTMKDFENIKNCVITDSVIDYYKTHQTALLSSKSLSKFCPGGKCLDFTAEAVGKECRRQHISVLEGISEHWNLKVVDQLSVEVAYVSRDPRAIVSELKELGAISDEEVQVFSKQLCARMSSFMDYKSASHNVYQVFSYDKIASSPATSLSQLYHKLLDTTHIPPLNLSKEYKNQLYLSVTEWENKLMQISVDAVNEECAFVINNV